MKSVKIAKNDSKWQKIVILLVLKILEKIHWNKKGLRIWSTTIRSAQITILWLYRANRTSENWRFVFLAIFPYIFRQNSIQIRDFFSPISTSQKILKKIMEHYIMKGNQNPPLVKQFGKLVVFWDTLFHIQSLMKGFW